MSILIFMIGAAVVLAVEEAVESIRERFNYPRIKFNRPRQYKFN